MQNPYGLCMLRLNVLLGAPSGASSGPNGVEGGRAAVGEGRQRGHKSLRLAHPPTHPPHMIPDGRLERTWLRLITEWGRV